MSVRPYDPTRDVKAARRIWREIGWLRDKEEPAMDMFVGCGRAMVAEVRGEAECLVLSVPGEVCYLGEDLPLAVVTGVTTSRIARKQGLARRVTAQVIAADAAEGALVSALGMFEQGFYNQLGFGTGGYEHWVAFDPARLQVRTQARMPQRVSAGDWAAVHAARLRRMRGHGACNLMPPEVTRAEMMTTTNGFGLGYYGPDGALSHHMWIRPKDVEHGPYSVVWMSYQTYDQFLELMALLRNLGDQVRLVRMREPAGIQFQDLMEQPFKQRAISEKSRYESGVSAEAYWQMRINDLPGCLARTSDTWTPRENGAVPAERTSSRSGERRARSEGTTRPCPRCRLRSARSPACG